MMNLFHDKLTIDRQQAELRAQAALARQARTPTEHPIRNRVGARLVHLGAALMREEAVVDELQSELDGRIADAA